RCEPPSGAGLPAFRSKLSREDPRPRGQFRGGPAAAHRRHRRSTANPVPARCRPGFTPGVGRSAGPGHAGRDLHHSGALPSGPSGTARTPGGSLNGKVAMNGVEPGSLTPFRAASFWSSLRWSAWLGWQIDTNWATPWLFLLYVLIKPLAG